MVQWVVDVFNELGAVSSRRTPLENRNYFEALDVEAKKFCKRSLEEGEWCLVDHWLRVFIANVGQGENTQKMFEVLGWDYEKSLNPTYDSSTTIHKYEWIDNGKSVEIPFLLQSRGHLPIGSKWKNGKSKTIWEVQFLVNGIVEVINEKGNIKKVLANEFVSRHNRID